MNSELINVRPDARKESHGCHGTLEREEWRAVKWYEGYYEVSSFGRVRSLDRIVGGKHGSTRPIKGKVLALRKDKDGYLRIPLWNGEPKAKNAQVHRLVVDAFVPNPDNLPCVNHRNEDKTCNIPDNLEPCTVAYNNTYGTKLQRQAESSRGRIPTPSFIEKSREAKRDKMKPILQLSLSGEYIGEFESIHSAVRQTQINRKSISQCCKGKLKTAGGFVWKFKE